MPDTRIVGDGQNLTPVTALTVRRLRENGSVNAIPVYLVNVSGDTYNAGGSSSGAMQLADGASSSILATVRSLGAGNPLAILQTNSSGDSYSGIGKPDVSALLFSFSALGQSVNVSNLAGIGSVAVQITGSFTATFTFEGTLDGTTWVSVNMYASSTGLSTTVTTGAGIWQGDVSGYMAFRVRASAYTSGTPIVTIIGRQSTLSPSIINNYNSKDYLLTLSGTVSGTRLQVNPISGQTGVDGGAGNVSAATQRVTLARDIGVPVSGDTSMVDGSNRTIKATVKSYANANPVAVALTNASGDIYSPTPKEPICATIPFRVSAGGTTTLAGPYNGRVIKVCSYDLQAIADCGQAYFGSGASGSQMTPQWQFGAREGVNKAVSPLGGGYIFKTILNQALVIENSGAEVRGSVTFHTGDSF